jgi:DNA-directed RNA polymerase specialized sigma24 family protein
VTVAPGGGSIFKRCRRVTFGPVLTHWGEVRDFENLTGYLYRVGQSRTRTTKERVYFERPESSERWYEPELVPALTKLTESQRTAVVLIYGFGWTMREVAECTGVKISSVQTHLDRGLKKLRAELKVMNNA